MQDKVVIIPTRGCSIALGFAMQVHHNLTSKGIQCNIDISHDSREVQIEKALLTARDYVFQITRNDAMERQITATRVSDKFTFQCSLSEAIDYASGNYPGN